MNNTEKIIVLFLDDDPIRVPFFSGEYRRADSEFIFVRNAEEFRTYLLNHSMPDVISFDHDLAEGHYTGQPTTERNGDYCAKWAIKNGYIPKHVIVHSYNPNGAKNIADRFKANGVPVTVKPFDHKRPHI